MDQVALELDISKVKQTYQHTTHRAGTDNLEFKTLCTLVLLIGSWARYTLC